VCSCFEEINLDFYSVPSSKYDCKVDWRRLANVQELTLKTDGFSVAGGMWTATQQTSLGFVNDVLMYPADVPRCLECCYVILIS